MKSTLKKAFTFLIVGVLGLVFRGAGFAAHAQTTDATASVVQTDFERELQQLKQQIASDLEAQKAASEIDSEDTKIAGDDFSDNVVIDGEKSSEEIQKEINDEVNIENPDSGANAEIGGGDSATSSLQQDENTPSFDSNGDLQNNDTQSTSTDGASGGDSNQ